MIENKVIIITGATSGIGKAAAELLGRNHTMILTGRRAKLLESLEQEIEKKKGTAICIPGDVRDEEYVQKVINTALERFGYIDVLINNAGIGLYKRIDEFTSDEFRQLFEVNVLGTFLFTKYTTPHMISRKRGQIINIASVAGLNGFKGGTAYAMSKFAQVGFTESLREDLKQYGIAVTALCPGSVATEFGGREISEKMKQQEYLLQPEDVARTIQYLVEESENANSKLIELKPRRRTEHRG